MLDIRSNKTLGIILVVLLIFAGFLYFGGGGKKERTFRKNIVEIDTSSVSSISIFPKSKSGKELKIFKDGDNWKINLQSGKIADVPKSKVVNLLNTLVKIKPQRLASKSEAKWGKYEVDDKATRVKVFEDGSSTLDLIIGKFSFQQPRTMNSYVRLADEKEVYEVSGFLEMQFNVAENTFRENHILNEDKENWKSLQFDYPADSSFTLANVNGAWTINGSEVDSAKTANYLNTLSKISGSDFIDENTSGKGLYTLTIERGDNSIATVTAVKTDSTIIINSSSNKDSYFDGNKNDLLKKIFVGMNKFKK